MIICQSTFCSKSREVLKKNTVFKQLVGLSASLTHQTIGSDSWVDVTKVTMVFTK